MTTSVRRGPLVLGIGCLAATLVTYLLAVRTETGRELDSTWLRIAREQLTQVGWLPDGGQLSRYQLPLLAIGLGVVCATCLVTRCRPSTAVAALAISCGPAVIADCLKDALPRPASSWDFGAHNSFPSGTVAAFAGMAAALTFLARSRPRRLTALVAWLVCGVVILTVLKAHWHRPSDVAGALLLAVGGWAIARGLTGSQDACTTWTRACEHDIPARVGL